MEHIGAGLAALGVIGPGIGIGILAGLAAAAIGRNPDAAGQIRGLAIILARSPKASASSRSSSACSRSSSSSRPVEPIVDLLAVATASGHRRRPARRRGGERAVPDQPVLGDRQRAQLRPVLRRSSGRSRSSRVSRMLAERQERIEQGLNDAEQARRDRENAEAERAGRARPRRAARRTRSWSAPRRSPRRRATRTSPRPAPSSSGCACARPPRSRPRRRGRSPTSAARSPTWPSWPPAGSSARP